MYCCNEIDQQTIERLDRDIGPVLIQGHRDYGDSSHIHISIDDQASTKALVLKLRDLFPLHFRRPEPSVLTFNYDRGDAQTVSSFVRRNFGVSWHGYFLARDHGVIATYPQSSSDADVLDVIGKTQNLIVPMNICNHAPLSTVARPPSLSHDFTVSFGENVWNFVHFWNDPHFGGASRLWDTGIDQMWLPPPVLEDENSYKNLLTVIERRVWTGSGQRKLKIVSYDHEVVKLEELAARFCTDLRSSMHRGKSENLQKGAFPIFEIDKPVEFLLTLPQHEHLRGKKVFIELEKPEEVSSEGRECWMVDLALEDPFQEPFFANRQSWWKLPRVSSLARLFTPGRPSRVLDSGQLTIEAGNREKIIYLSIPTKGGLFESLLSPRLSYTLTVDVRHSILHRTDAYLRLSDKGKYLNGVLNLFASLREAVYLFEHPFWRETLVKLCCPKKSEQVRAKAAKDILKFADNFVQEYGIDKECAVEWLAEVVLQAGEKVPGVEDSLCYANLEHSYTSYVEGLPSENDRACAAQEDLKNVLSNLTRTGVLLQGCEVRCEYCLSEFWYHVDDLGKTISCRGCRREISLPAERSWSYRPNELIRKGLREYGLLPVVRLIGRLFEKSYECFMFLAGAEMGDYESGGFASKGEIDLCWILDGECGIAEVKTSTKAFSSRDAEKLVKWATIAHPQKVLLVAIEGDDEGLKRWQQTVSGPLESMGIRVEAWGPSFFATPGHYFN